MRGRERGRDGRRDKGRDGRKEELRGGRIAVFENSEEKFQPEIS